jgi:hypothetical protein
MSGKPKIVREIYEKAPGVSKSVGRSQSYMGNGLSRMERRSVTSESDFANELYVRYSEDNGKSWTDWEDIYPENYRKRDDMELLWSTPRTGTYNSVHDHFVSLNMQRLFLVNHHDAYRKLWEEAGNAFTDHTFVWVSKDLGEWKRQLVTYEEGTDFDETDWAREGYVHVNEAYVGSNLEVLENGDIIFPVGANVRSCCRMIGLDVNDVFPSCPQIMKGLIVIRGRWNEGEYDLVPSKPVVISDLKSSRGVDEPTITVLKSGRILVVFRGSNVISEGWNTRIQKGTPAHKWYTYSDDDGKTFSDPVPWHYDNGEVFYSSATISHFFRSKKNGKTYWFGNISGPETYGNHPRYPLVMAEVDEETGFLKRDTHTVIDDRDPETESDQIQLSNFTILEDRETRKIELYLTRLGAGREDMWCSDAYKYTIEI